MERREKIKIKSGAYDIAVNIACLTLLAGLVIYLIAVWSGLPDQLPAHYNAEGVIDRWGGKGELLVLPIVAWVLYLALTGVEQIPKIWNTGVAVTAENRARVYRTLKSMIVTEKLAVVAIFAFLSLNSSLARPLPIWFLPVSLMLVFVPMVFFTVKLIRAR